MAQYTRSVLLFLILLGHLACAKGEIISRHDDGNNSQKDPNPGGNPDKPGPNLGGSTTKKEEPKKPENLLEPKNPSDEKKPDKIIVKEEPGQKVETAPNAPKEENTKEEEIKKNVNHLENKLYKKEIKVNEFSVDEVDMLIRKTSDPFLLSWLEEEQKEKWILGYMKNPDQEFINIIRNDGIHGLKKILINKSIENNLIYDLLKNARQYGIFFALASSIPIRFAKNLGELNFSSDEGLVNINKFENLMAKFFLVFPDDRKDDYYKRILQELTNNKQISQTDGLLLFSLPFMDYDEAVLVLNKYYSNKFMYEKLGKSLKKYLDNNPDLPNDKLRTIENGLKEISM